MYMAFAFWRVFYNVFLEDLGFLGAQIGTINALMQATFFFIVAFWGTVAEKHGIRPTLRLVALGAAITMFFLGDIRSFALLLFYIPLLTVFYNPIGPLTDAMATQYVQEEKKQSFGGFRLWGSLGWAIASIGGGFLFDFISLDYIFPISAGFFLISILFLSTRRKKRTFRPHFESLNPKELLANKSLLLFSLLVVFYGIVCAPVHSYINLYFTELNTGNDTVGFAYAIMATSELPLFILGNRLLKRWGHSWVIYIAIFTMFIRFILYGLFPTPVIGLVVGIMQGVTLPFFLVGAVEYLHKLLPGRHATGQSLIWGLFVGVGQTSGNLLIGSMLDQFGMVGVMQLFVPVALICLIYAVWYFRKS
jgi:PPP family 3-phenylpropionic acid transporter